nr:ribonuclease H-like domain-containing protein [Tanacetum cinerariifolium]
EGLPSEEGSGNCDDLLQASSGELLLDGKWSDSEDLQENGNSFKPVVETITDDAGTSTTIIPGLVTIEEKAKKKNNVKARKKHQLKFNSHKDAKMLMEAIEKRFGRNTETKKVQKTLLKQQFENFSGSSSEGLD